MQLVDKQGLGTMAVRREPAERYRTEVTPSQVYGLRTALNFQGTDYSWAVSIFYFGARGPSWATRMAPLMPIGYLAGSAVQGRGLQYFHSGKWIVSRSHLPLVLSDSPSGCLLLVRPVECVVLVLG
jgi:hypothetical protein